MSSARRLEVLRGQLQPSGEGGPLAAHPAAGVDQCPDDCACSQDGYSVVLPETLTGNQWVVRRRVSAAPRAPAREAHGPHNRAGPGARPARAPPAAAPPLPNQSPHQPPLCLRWLPQECDEPAAAGGHLPAASR